MKKGNEIYKLIKQVLTERDKKKILHVINELEEIGWTTSSPDLRRTLSGFVNHFEEYRTYLKYPELKLPITSNSAESFIGLVEEVLRRARGFKNIEALNEWIICVSKTRAEIKCNGNLPN